MASVVIMFAGLRRSIEVDEDHLRKVNQAIEKDMEDTVHAIATRGAAQLGLSIDFLSGVTGECVFYGRLRGQPIDEIAEEIMTILLAHFQADRAH